MSEECKHEYECVGHFVLTCNPPIQGENYRCHKCGHERSVQHPRSFTKPAYVNDEYIDNLTK
jgi:hypothetical protein